MKFTSGIKLWVDVAPIVKDDTLKITNGGEMADGAIRVVSQFNFNLEGGTFTWTKGTFELEGSPLNANSGNVYVKNGTFAITGNAGSTSWTT